MSKHIFQNFHLPNSDGIGCRLRKYGKRNENENHDVDKPNNEWMNEWMTPSVKWLILTLD